MAFPIPAHLPRKPKSLDISSQILTKIGEATPQTLTADLATSWLTELDASILATKKSIHERISVDPPAFERQLASARSVQTRLNTLTSGVQEFSRELVADKEGLIPQLSAKLTAHSRLAQVTNDAQVASSALEYLHRCKSAFARLTELVQVGQLPEAMGFCQELDSLLQTAPVPVPSSRIYTDMKAKFRVTKDRAQEQLSDAYSRIITITSSELTIRPSIQVRQSETVLSLAAILESLPPESLSTHLATLRKNLTTHYLNLAQPISVTVSSLPDGSQQLLRFPAPPQNEYPQLRIQTLTQVLEFLSQHLFPHFPDLPVTLCKPVSDGILNDVLVPSLPPRFDGLPSFLNLVQSAVVFEEEQIVGTLHETGRDRPIKSWTENLSGHYERNRRVLILGDCRDIVCKPEEPNDTFAVETSDKPAVVPVQEEDVDDDAWGFDEEEEKVPPKKQDNFGDDSWGFDDDVEPEPSAPAQVQSKPPVPVVVTDSADAWGLDDGDAAPEDDPWDDPWNDPPPPPVKPVQPPSPPRSASPAISSPRPAAGLAKFANKGKKSHLNGDSLRPDSPSPPPRLAHSPKPALGLGRYAAKNKSTLSVSDVSSSGYQTPPYSPALTHRTLSPAPPQPSPRPPSPPVPTAKRPPKLVPPVVVIERYTVSGRVRDILQLVQGTIDESKEFATSDLFPHVNGKPGAVLHQCADSVVDLYKAIYPIKFASLLGSSVDLPMRFSNDCFYLEQQLEGIEGYDTEASGECRRRLKVLGESWFDDTIYKHRQALNDILVAARGFAFTAEQEQYDECENAMNQALKHIRTTAGKWKPILTRTKYYTAVGSMVDAALLRVLDDVLALPDIPEVESHRIGELCRIFNALEGLFVEDADQPSVVVAWVPSWLKFSYLSELLEASMADITYLFEEGALVDFEMDELTGLVKGLFADTPLRASTLNKIMGGHPMAK